MVKQFLKKRSKRMSCRKRYKIEKKVKEHNKKAQRAAKKKQGKRKKKDPGVPNSFPFKDQVLQEAQRRREQAEEERQKEKERRKKEREKLVEQKRNLDKLVTDALKRTAEFDRKNAFVAEKSKEYTGGKAVETSLKAYYKEFKKVVDAADVVLQILDARDPLGSRCPQVEEAVLGAGSSKRLVLVLNKIDLVPKENVEKWLKYLRNEFPTVAFKASTQTQRENLSHSKVSLSAANKSLIKSSKCLGADLLMTLLGNYCRNQDIRTSITVGVVGFPNTGKSSIINSLKRCKACGVGATPGVTKSMQEVQLDKHVKLLDSPGIVMATGTSDSAVILKNCVKVENVEDPVPPVAAILKRCNKNQMMMHYGLADFSNVNEFLALLARRLGQLKKGGVPDVAKAGRKVLQDWNQGKIMYYTHPPEEYKLSSHLSAEIVKDMGKSFDIEALLKEEQDNLKGLKSESANDMVLEPSDPTAGDCETVDETMDNKEEEDIEESDMEDDAHEELSELTIPVAHQRMKMRPSNIAEKIAKKKKDPADSIPGNLQLNKARRMEFKKLQKRRKRADALSNKLSDALTGALDGLGGTTGQQIADEDYDFSVDFE